MRQRRPSRATRANERASAMPGALETAYGEREQRESRVWCVRCCYCRDSRRHINRRGGASEMDEVSAPYAIN